ncbi:MAG: prephenate dehydrogenase [Candidatus Hydrogenedentota bacterium]|jgi:prephenate dehydrogenase|uniref:Prephenate and/or arogenate dehydrogenase n=1 Tax=Sumerlaea chitinivorans TaxID=2250252 RepID=A0A2Z4Y1V4_SUMC1|nr:Prephenate and/or arogenate dehydrogenase [Candidatus Sumerlaea chitinivorans]RMH28057.1 MAG: prephenate dehydrogenase [Candidatus Hydrogenedentota bacterium]
MKKNRNPAFDRIAIVGVGLLGGSIGLAVKQRGLAREVVGIGRSPNSLKEALDLQVVDEVTTDLAEGIAEADLVILCTPVRHIVSILPEVLTKARGGALVTDVGSTKNTIVETAERVGSSAFFVGSHPMAGSEKSGVRYANADLFEDTTCFVTPTPQTSWNAFGRICGFWRALGCRLAVARPDRHDVLVALISHLPHLVAVALVRAVESMKEDQNLIKGIIGNGFRDTTRIACGNTQMWEDICTENHEAICRMHEAFTRSLAELLEAQQANPTALQNYLNEACQYRRFLDNR